MVCNGPSPPTAFDGDSESDLPTNRGAAALLLASIFVISACGLVYELLAGALSSYLLGNSITHFSLVIGIFVSAMGLGSFLSRYVTRNLIRTFLAVEIWVGLIGGTSSLILFLAFTLIDSYTALLIGVSVAVGTLVGLEIPLLVRILRGRLTLKAALGNVLAIDYLGALAAALLFPLVLVPRLGLVRSGFLFGLLNVAVALVGLQLFRHHIKRPAVLRASAAIVAGLLLLGLITAGRTTSLLEDVLYDDEVIYAKSTPYQRIVLTRWRDDIRLFIDGNIQFSSVDEFRYHEALVHPAMSLAPHPQQVLLLGAGDGMALREVLKYRSVRHVDLVDLDPEMTRMFSSIDALVQLNGAALRDSRVTIYNEDAQKYLERSPQRYDVIILDLPDPNNESLGKLYARSFYRLVAKHLSPVGLMVTQATSPFYATDAFWCIANTIAAANIASAGAPLTTLPYHASVPSFGEWGFVLAALRPLSPQRIHLTVQTRYLTDDIARSLFTLPKDIGPRPTPVNRLDNQVLLKLYERGYARYNR